MAKTAFRICFWSFVYTVAPLWTDVGTQECTQIGENDLSEPFWGICVHCCDASRVGWHECPNHHVLYLSKIESTDTKSYRRRDRDPRDRRGRPSQVVALRLPILQVALVGIQAVLNCFALRVG